MIIVRNLFMITLGIVSYCHKIICPALKLWYIFVTTMLRQITQFFFSISRIRVLFWLYLRLSLLLNLLIGFIIDVFWYSIFYNTFAWDNWSSTTTQSLNSFNVISWKSNESHLQDNIKLWIFISVCLLIRIFFLTNKCRYVNVINKLFNE